MSLLWLGDNGLFLKNFRERTRPASLAAAAIATALTVVVCVLMCYTFAFGQRDAHWESWAFLTLAVVQAIVLLLMGTVSVSNSMARERLVRTLDFHRVSPTSPFNMFLGLLAGGPILEWCVFLAVLPVAASLALRGGVRPGAIVFLYVSIILNAILFHCLAIVSTLGSSEKTLNRMLSVGGLGVCLGLAYLSFSSAYNVGRLSLYHLTCLPAFSDIASAIARGAWPSTWNEYNMFFQIPLPKWSLQFIVQCPIILLALMASIRRLAHAERPLFSKPLALAAYAYALFLVLGTLQYASPSLDGHEFAHHLFGIPLFCTVVFLMGCMGVAMTTPDYLIHIRALRRMKKEGRHLLSPFEDGASNLAWLALFFGLTICATLLLLWLWRIQEWLGPLMLTALTLSYVGWFAGGYELAMLAGKGKRKALTVVAFAVPWVFMPILGSLFAAGSLRIDLLYITMMAFCPFFGISMIAGAYAPMREVAEFMWLALAMNLVLAFVVLSIAWSARMRLYREQA